MSDRSQNIIDETALLMTVGFEYDPYGLPEGLVYPPFQEAVGELSDAEGYEVSKAFAHARTTQLPVDFATAGKMLATAIEAYWERAATAKAAENVDKRER